MQIRESAEDYLETILVLKAQNGNVRSIDIAHHLGYTRPSVSIAMKNLRENGYITVSEDQFITLTAKGLSIAESVYERHRLLTDCLQRLGVDPDTAKADACRIEHDLSDQTFARIKEFYLAHLAQNTTLPQEELPQNEE
ncbi:MAG: metal-dependent transcriptional regulator [Firmicutes bacterium]|nr:metal-dependent transcriptional regulator [Bacillota bacterium]